MILDTDLGSHLGRMVTHRHSRFSGTCTFNFAAGSLFFTNTDTPPELLATFSLIRLNFWYSLNGSRSAVALHSQVSVKTAISTLLSRNTSSVTIVLSVFSLFPKLWIFDKNPIGKHLM